MRPAGFKCQDALDIFNQPLNRRSFFVGPLMADMIDENQLVEQAKTDPEAFGKLYELYVEKIYNAIKE